MFWLLAQGVHPRKKVLITVFQYVIISPTGTDTVRGSQCARYVIR